MSIKKIIIVIRLIFHILLFGFFIIKSPDVLAQNVESSNKKAALIFSGSVGIASTDTILNADYISFQANIGYWKMSFFLLPICINITYSLDVSYSPGKNQTDIHLTTFFPWGGSKIFFLPTLGPGVSFGTRHDDKNNNNNLQLKSFVLPSFLVEGEISFVLSDYFMAGLKGSISFNKERTLKGFMFTVRYFKEL